MRTPVASRVACATVTNVDVVQVALVGECQADRALRMVRVPFSGLGAQQTQRDAGQIGP
jgi:hypothetical protein